MSGIHSLLDITDEPCEMGEFCKNSPTFQENPRCGVCRFSPQHYPSFGEVRSSYWKPVNRGIKHPKVEAERRQLGITRRREAQKRRQDKDKKRQKRAYEAIRAEKTTERRIIQATRNSGRALGDGDHLAAGRITLDTKLQSRVINPTVKMGELYKAKLDAQSNGNPFGGLVLRNKLGAGVVVMYEQDFARLIGLIAALEEKNAGSAEES